MMVSNRPTTRQEVPRFGRKDLEIEVDDLELPQSSYFRK